MSLLARILGRDKETLGQKYASWNMRDTRSHALVKMKKTIIVLEVTTKIFASIDKHASNEVQSSKEKSELILLMIQNMEQEIVHENTNNKDYKLKFRWLAFNWIECCKWSVIFAMSILFLMIVHTILGTLLGFDLGEQILILSTLPGFGIYSE